MNNFLNDIRNEEDMLKGNINRMCVCNDFKELDDMFSYAVKRLGKIFAFNYRRLREKKYAEHDAIVVDDFMKGVNK